MARRIMLPCSCGYRPRCVCRERRQSPGLSPRERHWLGEGIPVEEIQGAHDQTIPDIRMYMESRLERNVQSYKVA